MGIKLKPIKPIKPIYIPPPAPLPPIKPVSIQDIGNSFNKSNSTISQAFTEKPNIDMKLLQKTSGYIISTISVYPPVAVALVVSTLIADKITGGKATEYLNDGKSNNSTLNMLPAGRLIQRTINDSTDGKSGDILTKYLPDPIKVSATNAPTLVTTLIKDPNNTGVVFGNIIKNNYNPLPVLQTIPPKNNQPTIHPLPVLQTIPPKNNQQIPTPPINNIDIVNKMSTTLTKSTTLSVAESKPSLLPTFTSPPPPPVSTLSSNKISPLPQVSTLSSNKISPLPQVSTLNTTPITKKSSSFPMLPLVAGALVIVFLMRR